MFAGVHGYRVATAASSATKWRGTLSTHTMVSRFMLAIWEIELWTAQVLRTAVPEASTHKNGETVLAEYKIRAAGQRQMPPPAFDSMPAENLYEAQFGGLVAFGPHDRHDLRPFLFGDGI